MPLTYEESSVLMNDMKFRGRVKVAALRYASTILNEDDNVPAHVSRVRWAQGTYQQPDMVAQQLQPPTVMDPAVQGSGAEIGDQQLQAAVEGVINKLM